jgi:serine/threonine protein kinase
MLDTDTLVQSRYRIIRQIGKGGMGTVYLARDENLGVTVAVKQNFFDDARLIEAFKRESRLLAGLRHSALPQVKDYFINDTGQYLVMEYIAGDDFGTLLEKRQQKIDPIGEAKPFEVSELMRWAEQLLDALDYLHTLPEPVIHRDIKPQNLKLAGRNQIVLLDFGLAKGKPQWMTRVTTTGSIYGYTPNYAPLEQIRGVGTDPRSDLYALGATLYHLITGTPPMDAATRAEMVLSGDPDPLLPANEVNAKVPRGVAELLKAAMEPARNKRPASAAVMLEMLRAVKYATVLDPRAREGDGSSRETEIVDTPPKIEVTTEIGPDARMAEEQRQQEEARQAREEAERQQREEDERRQREAAELKAREEAERKQREAEERRAHEEAERKQREAAERLQQQREQEAREHQEREAARLQAQREQEERERLTMAEALRQDQERQEREVAERRRQQEAERKAREAAERRSQQEEARKAQGAEALRQLEETLLKQQEEQFRNQQITAQSVALTESQKPSAGRRKTLLAAVAGIVLLTVVIWAIVARMNKPETPLPNLLTTAPARLKAGAYTTQNKVAEVSFSDDGQVLASAGEATVIHLWQTDNERQLSGHKGNVKCVALSHDGRLVASSSDNTILLQSISDGQTLKTLTGHSGAVFSVGFSSDGQTLYSASYDKTIKLWRVSDGGLIKTVKTPEQGYAIVAVSPGLRLVGFYRTDGNFKLWSLEQDDLIRMLDGDVPAVNCGAFSPDGKLLALGSSDGKVELWDVSDGRLLRSLGQSDAKVMSVTFSTDGQVLAAGFENGAIRLWRISSGQLLTPFTSHAASVNSLSFSADGRLLASGSDDKTVRVSNVPEK